MTTWLKDGCCARRWFAAAVLSLSCTVSASESCAQEVTAYPKHPPAASDGTIDNLEVWKRVTLGTRKGVDDYRQALERAAIKIGDSADEILGRPTFRYHTTKTDAELVAISVAQLGVEREVESLASIYQRARRIGLELCPAEVGPQLRLDYRDQPLGDAVHIAMEPIAAWSGQLLILALVNFGSGLALISNNGQPDFVAPRNFRFVFALPGRPSLEARKRPQ
jgi:hypothetical protein